VRKRLERAALRFRGGRSGAAVMLLTMVLLPLSVGDATAQNGRGDAARLRRIEAYVEKARRDWEVPGLALAIVKHDSVIFAKGFGTRTLGRDEPVNEHTLFAIGSSSKAFTAAAVALLVDEGKIRFTDPARRHLPQLRFYEEYVTREITIRDLLSHSSGLPRYDQLWGLFNYPREEILRRVQYLEPNTSFRSTYGYQNIMFLAAGELVHAVDGRSWDDFIARRIFEPLGMTRSTTTIRLLEGRDNVATPHGRVNDAIVAIPYRNIDNIAPAGSINSSVRDMAEWVRLQLGRGVHNGKRLLSDSVMREMHTPQTVIRRPARDEQANPFTNFAAYGLGWMLEDYRGRKVIHHGGNIDGMTALVALLPNDSVGFVLLENLNGSGLRTPLMHYIFDRFLDADERDWSREYLERARQARVRAAANGDSTAQPPTRVPDTRPSRPLARYAGTYENPIYGEVVVAEENGKLVLRAGNGGAIHVELEHWHFDTFRTRNLDPAAGALRDANRIMVTYALDARGEPRSLVLGNIGEFRRRPARDGR
jgi:CubicO group peptidase (beta-lactamase class C family)